jgi:hypothetical protein
MPIERDWVHTLWGSSSPSVSSWDCGSLAAAPRHSASPRQMGAAPLEESLELLMREYQHKMVDHEVQATGPLRWRRSWCRKCGCEASRRRGVGDRLVPPMVGR